MGDENLRYGYYPRCKTQKRRTMKEIKSDFNKYQEKLYPKRVR